MENTILIAICLRVLGAACVWFKSNAKAVFGLEYGALFWWLILGWPVEFAFLESWWRLSEKLGPFKASVWLSAIGMLITVLLMSIFYGFNLKYISAMSLILIAGWIMRF